MQEKKSKLVLIFDEYDKYPTDIIEKFASFIKTLESYSEILKFVLVGISDDSSQLIAGHPSLVRSLVGIELKEMNLPEVTEVIDLIENKMDKKFNFSEPARTAIWEISHGYPYFVHTICKEALELSIDKEISSTIPAEIIDTVRDKIVKGLLMNDFYSSYKRLIERGINRERILKLMALTDAAVINRAQLVADVQELGTNNPAQYIAQIIAANGTLKEPVLRFSPTTIAFLDPAFKVYCQIAPDINIR